MALVPPDELFGLWLLKVSCRGVSCTGYGSDTLILFEVLVLVLVTFNFVVGVLPLLSVVQVLALVSVITGIQTEYEPLPDGR